jgi:predicted MFS family arabinose efflux permease
VVILLSLGRLPIELTVLIAVFTGLLGPALSGGWTAQLPSVVPREGLPHANAVDAMTFSVASLVGPALAGALAGLLGAPAAVVASVALIAIALPAAWRLPAVHGPERIPPTVSVAGDLAAGFRCIARTPPLARATLTSVISCTGLGMLITCTPSLGERAFGSAAHGTMLLSCTAVSALAANAVLSRHPRAIAPDTIIWSSTLLLAAALVLTAAGHPALVIAAALTAGVGEGPQLTALFTVRHREAPEHLRSQIFTTGASLKLTGFALGAAVAGPIATRSLTAALLTAAGVQIVAGLSYSAVILRGTDSYG